MGGYCGDDPHPGCLIVSGRVGFVATDRGGNLVRVSDLWPSDVGIGDGRVVASGGDGCACRVLRGGRRVGDGSEQRAYSAVGRPGATGWRATAADRRVEDRG